MIPSLPTAGSSDGRGAEKSDDDLPLETTPLKFGRIVDQEGGRFSLEYDDTRGQKNWMRLDAFSYEGAIREARSYLGIQDDDRDEDGDRWMVE